jgi:hypothetical protein
MAYTKYSLTPANNNAAPPNGAPEGMLPSGVNDTMRDMMAQIRDVGDGIRDGTYTMTAPVITGGSITGVALSGNTLTNPVITGGSINNTPIGASTANTGAFTTLGASSTATLNTLVSSGATITGGTISGVSLSATSPNFTTPVLGTPSSGTLTNCTGLPVSTGISGLGANVATFLATPSSANLASAVTDETGSGALVFATSPTLTTPNLGTPSAATLTNATGLPVATGISGLGTGVATFLATPSSANLRTAVTDETGSGALVFATSPTLVTPVLGVATATSVQGIIGNVAPAAGTFTTLTANGNTTLGDAAGDITTVPDLKALQVTSADRHSVRPSLLLDFANTKTLDPRITFTRASTATFYDGKTTVKAEENFLLRSQDYSATWTVTNLTPVTGKTAPDGTSTATEFTASAANAVLTQGFTAIAGSYTFSVYLRRVTGTGDIQIAADNGTWNTKVITATWARYDITQTATAGAKTAGIRVVDSGDAIEVWGAQLEQRSAVSAYNVTTTAPITNYIPALQSAASGVARFEHNPITGESLGLEIEEQRTNLQTHSENFTTGTWTVGYSSNITVTPNVAIAPNGTQTASQIVNTTATGNHFLAPNNIGGSYSVGQIVTNSIYAKAYTSRYLYIAYAASPSTIAQFDLVAGTATIISGGLSGTCSIQAVGNGWYRCIYNITLAATSIERMNITPSNTILTTGTWSSFTGDGYSGVFIWGAQVEAGAFATSYIPTTTAQVTRSADAASMTGTNFSSWFRTDEGTLYAEGNTARPSSDANGVAFSINDNSSANRIQLGLTTNDTRAVRVYLSANGTEQVSDMRVGTITVGQFTKNAFVYKVNDFIASSAGSLSSADTSGSIPTVNQLTVGYNGVATNSILCGNIKKLAYYPKRLTNAELQGLTTV